MGYRNMARLYRFPENIPTGISELRYARLCPFLMSDPTIWASAIRRLMAAKGFKSAADLIRDAADRGIKLRPNTLSDAMKVNGKPRMDTLQNVAAALGVPLWALYCSEREYAAFTAANEQTAAALNAQQSAEEMRRELLAELAPIVDAAVAKLRGTPQPAPVPQPEMHVVKTARKKRA